MIHLQTRSSKQNRSSDIVKITQLLIGICCSFASDLQMTDKGHDELAKDKMSPPIEIKLEEPSISVQESDSNNGVPVFAVPMEIKVSDAETSKVSRGGVALSPALGPPAQKSLLGADLTIKPASLAMPPPTCKLQNRVILFLRFLGTGQSFHFIFIF